VAHSGPPFFAEDFDHEMGNSDRRGFPLRHGNHDVRVESLKGDPARPAQAGRAIFITSPPSP
jgi:hypothetical protein